MSLVKTTSYDSLLSRRARLELPTSRFGTRGGPATVAAPLYQFGGGFPDPGSFPFSGLVRATEEMLQSEGKEALTYGHGLGYLGLRELVCEKTKHYEGFDISVDNVIITNGSTHALLLTPNSTLGSFLITSPQAASGVRAGGQSAGASVQPVIWENVRTTSPANRVGSMRMSSSSRMPCRCGACSLAASRMLPC